MNIPDYKKNRKNGFSRIGLALVLPFILLVIAYIVYKLFFIPDPVVYGIEDLDLLPLDKTVTLQTENLKSIDIALYQGNSMVEILKDTPETSGKVYTLQIKPKTLNLKNGPAVIVIRVRAGILKKIKYEIKTIIDTIPPALEILSAPSIVHQGSGGFALLSAKGADSVFIKLEDKVFRAFQASSESVSNNDSLQEIEIGSRRVPGHSQKGAAKDYYVFFPAPFDSKEEDVFYVIAEDAAGNRNINTLSTRIKAKRIKDTQYTEDEFS